MAPRRPALTLLLLAAALALPARGAAARFVRYGPLRTWTIHYRAHDGARRIAYVLLPAWYGPRRDPPIPLVISPHGRGVPARANARIWGTLPARGGFAVVAPDGEGRKLARYSWGAAGQISDLARMPQIVRRALPWLLVDARRVYAFGGSMGGQETLLLLARHPRLLAGAAVFDAVADFRRQYLAFPELRCDRACRRTWHGPIGPALQSLARQEIGGPPRKAPYAWRLRSPITYVRAIAGSCVPLQVWWSSADRIVLDQRAQSGRLVAAIRRVNPDAPVESFRGLWRHSAEMRARARLPFALASFGLLPPTYLKRTAALHVDPAPPESAACGDARS